MAGCRCGGAVGWQVACARGGLERTRRGNMLWRVHLWAHMCVHSHCRRPPHPASSPPIARTQRPGGPRCHRRRRPHRLWLYHAAADRRAAGAAAVPGGALGGCAARARLLRHEHWGCAAAATRMCRVVGHGGRAGEIVCFKFGGGAFLPLQPALYAQPLAWQQQRTCKAQRGQCKGQRREGAWRGMLPLLPSLPLS
jgi:hypothetical protein